jgi:DNA-binding transcriptional LysR family regulator
MDYNRVALFVRVAKAGSFTAAAHVAGLPKSSVSRSIARLEQDLGVRLLQRTTRKLALTAAGQAYFEAVQGSVAAIDEADEAAREHGAEPRGAVRLTAPPDLNTLADAVARFSKRHPGIRVEVLLTPRYLDLVTEGVDLAVRAGRLEDSSLVARRVGGSEMALMAAPSYLAERGEPKTLDDLAAHDFVLYRATAGRATLSLSGAAGARTVEVTGTIVADDLAFVRGAVEAGAGIALLPIHTVLRSIEAQRLKQVLPEWSYGDAALFVVLPTGRHVPARVALLRDFLVDALGKELAATHELCARKKARKPERHVAARRDVLVQPSQAR